MASVSKSPQEDPANVTSCPFARLGHQALSLAHAIEPAKSASPLAEIITALLAAGPGTLGQARAQDLEALFGSIDLSPFRAQPLTESELGGGPSSPLAPSHVSAKSST